MMLPRSPRPRSAPSLMMFSAPPGMHHDRHPSSAALAQNGSYLGSERSSPLTCPPIEAPRMPRRLTPSSSCSAASVRMLQRHRRRRHEAVGMRRHPPGQALVLRRHDPAGEVAVGGVPPEAVDGQDLDVDTLLVHHREPLGTEDAVAAAAALRQRRALHDVLDRDHAVRVHVDHPDGAAVDASPGVARAEPGRAPTRGRDRGR